ncbi:MAG: hypothetical protein M3342_14230 [Bacteroidota bacterium]|nr:hypothetical protein [Flavisolibacter sp.]MDQ3845149.1 hypothetical protein [Bacteroidota bacterium]MBD0298146.1 hypothetical protein [Flavisolibacter sp.]MBD0350974.1 hypothetical protein [Flavisolibacter sp.]MBD0364832.1 hypothetical protein [Flavisolibacter sp.]
MTENKNGIHFAWFTGGNNPGCYYTKSTDNRKSFLMHDSVSAKGSHPQLASLPNGELLIVWDESHIENKRRIKRLVFKEEVRKEKAKAKIISQRTVPMQVTRL